jgi:hypothetical protein
VRLVPLLLRLERRPGALRPQILAELARHGRPLRWAITAVEADTAGVPHLQIEAVVLA